MCSQCCLLVTLTDNQLDDWRFQIAVNLINQSAMHFFNGDLKRYLKVDD